MIKKVFYEKMYQFNWTLIVLEKKKDERKVIKFLKKLDCEFEGITEANGWSLHRNGECIIILNAWKDSMKGLTYLLSIVRHEVHHLCADIFDNIGENANILDSETFLYFNDYIFRKILDSKAFGKVVDKLK